MAKKKKHKGQISMSVTFYLNRHQNYCSLHKLWYFCDHFEILKFDKIGTSIMTNYNNSTFVTKCILELYHFQLALIYLSKFLYLDLYNKHSCIKIKTFYGINLTLN